MLAPLTLADAGIPTLGLFWPVAWLLFVPVVALEAWRAKALLAISTPSALLLSGVANLASTAVGLPLTWAGLAFLEVAFAGTALGLDSLLGWLYACTVQSPWLVPYDSELRVLAPLALGALAVPLCAASVAIEYATVRAAWRPLDHRLVRRWAIQGNVASYALLAVAAAALSAAGAGWHSRLFSPITTPLAEWVLDLASRLAGSG